MRRRRSRSSVRRSSWGSPLGHGERLSGGVIGRVRGARDPPIHPPRECRTGDESLRAMHDGPTGAGLSHAAIREQCDASLRRLGTDWIDVYFIHRFDEAVPVEETMEALHDLVTAGKVRYLGASSMWAWQFAKMQTAAALNGWTPFPRCRTSTTSSSARRSGRCCPCALTWASESCRTRLRRRAAHPAVGKQTGAVRGGRGREVLRLTGRPADRGGRRGRRAERGVTMAPSPWPGCSATPSSPPPSSAPRSRTISRVLLRPRRQAQRRGGPPPRGGLRPSSSPTGGEGNGGSS